MKKDIWHCSDRACRYIFFPIQLGVNFNKNSPVVKLWSVTDIVQVMVNIAKRPFLLYSVTVDCRHILHRFTGGYRKCL